MRNVISIIVIGLVCAFAANAQSGKAITLDQKVSGTITKLSTVGFGGCLSDQYALSLKAQQKVTITLVSDHPMTLVVLMRNKHYVVSPGGEERTDVQATIAAGSQPETAVLEIDGPVAFTVRNQEKPFESQTYVVSMAAAAKGAEPTSAQEDEYGGN